MDIKLLIDLIQMDGPLILPADAGHIEWLLLPDLATNDTCVFGFDGSCLYRLKTWIFDANLKEYSSVFGNYIIKDGNLRLASRLDPLFLLLKLFEQKDHMYYGLDDLLSVPEFPDLSRISTVFTREKLDLICDINQEIQDDLFVRVNQIKLLEWLKTKVSKISDTDYATRLLSDYLSQKLLKELRTHLGLKDMKESNENYYTDQIVIKKRVVQEKKTSVKKVLLGILL